MKHSWLVWITALSMLGAGCSTHKDSPELSALNSAYKAGLLTKAEYDAKRAALESKSGPMAALESAYQSGVLTKEEYEAKKAAMQSQTGALDALEKARSSGVLTQEEYDTKKAALLAGSAVPSPATISSAPASEMPATPGAATPSVVPTGTPPPVTPSGATSYEEQPPMAAARPAPTPAAGNDGHTYRLKMMKAVDAQGFERPMTSASMLVPVDWQTEGGTSWNIKDKCNTIRTTLRGSGPDGRAYEIFPTYNWTWADDPRPLQQLARQSQAGGIRPCEVAPAMSAKDYIQRNLRQIRPNAQLVGFEPAPQLTESLAQQARQTEAAARQYNLNQRVRYDAIKARVKYELQGKPVEEWIIAATVITGTLGPSYNMQTGQMGQAYTYNCVAYMGAQRAPQGQLDASAKFFELIGSTYRVDPQWQAKVLGNAQAMQQIELKGVRDRSAIVAKSAEDTRNTMREMYENKNRVDDRISAQRSQSMRDVETYRNPSTGDTVELSNQYGNAWVNNRGEYLLSDQAGFDPNTVFKNNEGWKPLEHVKK